MRFPQNPLQFSPAHQPWGKEVSRLLEDREPHWRRGKSRYKALRPLRNESRGRVREHSEEDRG